MASERTPLIRTVVIVPRGSPKYLRAKLSRCVLFLLCIALVFSALGALTNFKTFFDRGRRPHHSNWPWQSYNEDSLHLWRAKTTVEHDDVKHILLDTPDAEHVARWSNYYTSGAHLAGKNRSQAEWTRNLWQSFGIESRLVSYEVYLNYPVSSRLTLLRTKRDEAVKVEHECSLKEDVLDEDPTTSLKELIPAFHGYSASGNVTAQYVYVNFGTFKDFEDVFKAGVPLKGKIAVVKYGRNFRGIKVEIAQNYGIIGVVMYDDPQEDGDITEANGYKPYPEGPARHPSSLQRGSVQFLSSAPGDPTTIGYPSKPGVPRMDPNETIPYIPSLPISYRDAIPLLRALNGHGPSSRDFNKYWQGGGLGHVGVDYNIGPSPPDLVLNLVNLVEYTTTPLWNVIGIVNGTGLCSQSILVGNHRDAWTPGAGDPNSGSGVLNEIVRGYGKALQSGWTPQRTTVFASWDGEEYGLVGSTEWVEEYVPWLKAEAMSYLNVDTGASGTVFKASASPLLNFALKNAAASVTSPNQTVKGQTVYDVWKEDNNARISTLGSGSDYTAFMDFAGISSIDLGFKPGKDNAIFHYHSIYDSFNWMAEFGDPGFEYHVACAKLLSVMLVDLVETPVIPYLASDYANALITYVKSAKKSLDGESDTSRDLQLEPRTNNELSHRHLELLHNLTEQVKESATKLDRKADKLMRDVQETPHWWRWLHGRYLRREVQKVNEALKSFERSFLYDEGLSGRSWFKHVIFAPGRWTGYAGSTLPGLTESINNGDSHEQRKWEHILARKLETARDALDNGL